LTGWVKDSDSLPALLAVTARGSRDAGVSSDRSVGAQWQSARKPARCQRI